MLVIFRFLIKCIRSCLYFFALFCLIVTVTPPSYYSNFDYFPSTKEYFQFQDQEVHEIPDKSTRLFHLDGLYGPESLAIRNNLLYTGLADGRIVEIEPHSISPSPAIPVEYSYRTLFRYNNTKTCDCPFGKKPWFCGRFLQIRFFNDTLYAIESKTGLYEIDTKVGGATLVTYLDIEGKNFFNSFVFDPVIKNIVYITISSKKWSLATILWSFFEHENTGQIIAVDLDIDKSYVIFDKLYMPNGIEIDSKRDELLFSETSTAKVKSASLEDIRNALKILRLGNNYTIPIETKDVISLTPGFPDNLRIHDDILYVALPSARPDGIKFIDYLINPTTSRIVIGRIIYAFGCLLEFLDKFTIYPTFQHAALELKTGHVFYQFGSQHSGFYALNRATGRGQYFDTQAGTFISEASPSENDEVFLGSFRNPMIMRIETSWAKAI